MNNDTNKETPVVAPVAGSGDQKEYFFPAYGVMIKAVNQAEALKQLQKQIADGKVEALPINNNQ